MKAGKLCEWASDDLKGDREIVLAAVSQSEGWQALEWASDDLKGDSEIFSQTNFEGQGFALKVSLLSARSCIVLASTRVPVSDLVAPYCAIPRDYLSDTPLLRTMGFSVSQHGQLGAISPAPFLSVSPLGEHAKWRCDTPPSKGVSQRYLRDTL